MERLKNSGDLLSLLGKIEILIQKLLMIGGVALLCSQLALTQDKSRQYLSYVDKLEGTRIHGEQIQIAEAPLEIREKTVTAPPSPEPVDAISRLVVIALVDPLPSDKVFVRINGKEEIPFKNGEAAIRLQEGDLLEIDGSKIIKKLQYTIAIPHSDIDFPANGQIIESQANIVSVGLVRFKR
jgi:hypothetical protein